MHCYDMGRNICGMQGNSFSGLIVLNHMVQGRFTRRKLENTMYNYGSLGMASRMLEMYGFSELIWGKLRLFFSIFGDLKILSVLCSWSSSVQMSTVIANNARSSWHFAQFFPLDRVNLEFKRVLLKFSWSIQLSSRHIRCTGVSYLYEDSLGQGVWLGDFFRSF